MPEKKKSLLQVLKDAINSYQEQEPTEEEQEVLEDVKEDVSELEEVADDESSETTDQVAEEEPTETEIEEVEEDVEEDHYSVEEAITLLDGLSLSEESIKEAAEFLSTISKETTDKLVPLLRKVLEETTVSSIKTLLSSTKSSKPKAGAKAPTKSLGKEMAQEANNRKGK